MSLQGGYTKEWVVEELFYGTTMTWLHYSIWKGNLINVQSPMFARIWLSSRVYGTYTFSSVEVLSFIIFIRCHFYDNKFNWKWFSSFVGFVRNEINFIFSSPSLETEPTILGQWIELNYSVYYILTKPAHTQCTTESYNSTEYVNISNVSLSGHTQRV